MKLPHFNSYPILTYPPVLSLVVMVFFTGTCPLSLAEPGLITIRILDEHGEATPARAWVDAQGERLYEPTSPDSATPYPRDRSFSFDGSFTMEVPAGEVLVHVEKGKEYRSVDLPVKVFEGQATDQSIQLERWVDMPAEGWFSADLHVHLGQDDVRVLRQLALADDVHLIPAFSYWLRGREETWNEDWPDGSYTRPIQIDDHHFITRNNIEIERISRDSVPGGMFGATFLYNLNRPVTASLYGEHFPTDASLCLVAKTHSPGLVLDSDKPSWAETVIGVALGAMDTIQLCHNHYHRDSTIAGGWGMIGPLEAGESNSDTGDGLFHRTNSLYYRFLNCGFRLGVSGGSAIGVMPVATGQHRVYAKIEGPMSTDKYWEALKAGRSFATSGPMLELTAEGATLGDTLEVDSANPPTIAVSSTVRAIEPLEALQIIHNGVVVSSVDLRRKQGDSKLTETLTHELVSKRSGWITARALFRASDGLLRQAHTSPIYLSVDGKPTASARDAKYMLRWIDILETLARENPDRYPSSMEQAAVLADYQRARSKYLEIVVTAVRNWGD